MEKTIIEFQQIFSVHYFQHDFFFSILAKKKNYEQVLMTLKVKIIMGFKSVRHSVQLPSSTKIKKAPRGNFAKKFGKKAISVVG